MKIPCEHGIIHTSLTASTAGASWRQKKKKKNENDNDNDNNNNNNNSYYVVGLGRRHDGSRIVVSVDACESGSTDQFSTHMFVHRSGMGSMRRSA